MSSKGSREVKSQEVIDVLEKWKLESIVTGGGGVATGCPLWMGGDDVAMGKYCEWIPQMPGRKREGEGCF